MTGKNEVTIDVVVRERGGKKVLKDTEDGARKTGKAFGEMGKDAQTLSKQLFDMDIQIRKTAQDLERTGDTSLVKNIRKQQRELAALVKVRRDVLGISFGGKDDSSSLAQAGVKAGTSFGMSLVDSASKAMSSGGTKFVAAAAAAIAVASPFIGAAMAGAILGTTGTLGIAGGIAMAAQDPRVKSAAADLGGTFMREFGTATEPFIGPTIAALQHFEDAAIDVAGKLSPEFDDLADHVAPLAKALGDMVIRMLPGFKEALKAAGPALNAVADALPGLGEDLGAMFGMIASQPAGAVAGLHDLIAAIGAVARAVGFTTAALSSYYEMVIGVGEVTTRWSLALPQWVKDFGMLDEVATIFASSADAARNAFRDAPEIVSDFGEAAEEAKEQILALNDAVESFISKQLGADQARVNWEQGLRDLNDELREGKRVLGLNTEEGLKNRDALLEMIGEAESFRQKLFEQTGDLEGANAAYQNNIATLYNMAKAAGFTRSELDLLFAPYLNGPRIAETEFRFPGLLAGLAAARELARLTGSYSAAARERAGDTSGYGGGRASGGYMAPGMTYHVAESGTGVERVKMLQGGGAVVQNMDQWSAAGSGGGVSWSGGGGAQHVIWEVRSGGSEVDDLITQIIRRTVTVVGGGNVQKTYGRDDR